MASEQPDLNFLPGILGQECATFSDDDSCLVLEGVQCGLAVYVAIAIDAKQVQMIEPRVATERRLDKLPLKGLARPVEPRIIADMDTRLWLADGPHHRLDDRPENVSVLHRIFGED